MKKLKLISLLVALVSLPVMAMANDMPTKQDQKQKGQMKQKEMKQEQHFLQAAQDEKEQPMPSSAHKQKKHGEEESHESHE